MTLFCMIWKKSETPKFSNVRNAEASRSHPWKKALNSKLLIWIMIG